MRPTIVCAETDAHLFEIHQQALAGAGYRVLPARDGEEALATLHDEAVDLALLDTGLPRRDGLAVVEELRAGKGSSRTLPVLLLCSGRISPEFRRRADSIGDVSLLAKPVPIEALLERIGRLVKATPEGGRRSVSVRPPKTGSLRQVHLASLFHALHGVRAGGVLFLEHGKKKKAIQFRDGYPIAVKSNLVTECLGNMLARRGKLSEEALAESLARLKKGEGLQGEILVAMQVLDEDAVAEALREQAEGKLFEIFGWRSGNYRFQMGKRLQRANTLSLSGSPANLVVEGARRHVPLKRIDDFLARNQNRYPARAESPFYRFQSIDLSDAEARVVDELDGQSTLGRYLDAAERVRRTLYALAMIGLLELSDESSGEAEAPSAAAVGESSPGHDEPELRRELTALAQRLRAKTYYEMLELPTTADDAAVEKAYAAQVKRVHPDRYRSSSGSVRQVADEIYGLFTRAYEALRDAEGRAAYADALKRDAASQRQEAKSKKALVAETAFQRAEAALRQRDYEGALVFFGSALEQRPEEGLYHAYYGWCLHLCHPDNEVMIHEAIEHVQKGVKLAREHELPYLFLGRLYKVLGRTEAAEKMFTRAVSLRSDCVEALRELRLLNMRRDKQRGLFGRILKR